MHSEQWLEKLSGLGSAQKKLPVHLGSLAQAITRLADDQVELDEVETSLLSLVLGGSITTGHAISLQSRYLREQEGSAVPHKALFDPFGDLDSRGYLRITTGDSAPSVIKQIEHFAFSANIEKASAFLQAEKTLSYPSLLRAHQLLFGSVYPWAGQDRLKTSPALAIWKVSGQSRVEFAQPTDIRRSVEYALKLSADPVKLIGCAGEVLACLAYAHPFLDGNGRAILLLHIEICRRAGLCVDWHHANAQQFLVALGADIENPAQNAMNSFLAPLIHQLA